MLALVAGCCSQPVLPPKRPLPAGRPAEIVKELQKRERTWQDQGDKVLIPSSDLELILIDRMRWQAYAYALERAGGWQR